MARRGIPTATLDRIERDDTGSALAVLVFDDGQQLVLPLETLPAGSRPGQVMRLSLEVDPEETARRAAEVSALQRELFDG